MQESTGTPVAGVSDQERRNSYPEIPTKFVGRKFVQTRWREEISGITGQTNKDFNSRNFILTDSPVHKRFRVGK